LNEIPNSWITCPGGEKTALIQWLKFSSVVLQNFVLKMVVTPNFFSPVIGENIRGVVGLTENLL